MWIPLPKDPYPSSCDEVDCTGSCYLVSLKYYDLFARLTAVLSVPWHDIHEHIILRCYHLRI